MRLCVIKLNDLIDNMIAYYFALFVLIFIVAGLHFSFYYSQNKPLLIPPIIFTLLSIGFVFLTKQNLELLHKFDKRQNVNFVPKEKIFEKRNRRERKIFAGFRGEILKGKNRIEYGFLHTQIFYNLKDEKITINDTLKVWNIGENNNLILQNKETETDNFLINSIIEQLFIILLCNSLWFRVFKGTQIATITSKTD